MAERVIDVATVVIQRSDGHILTVRKRGTVRFMLPGGKPEPGEAAIQTAIRETQEEIGLVVDPDELTPLGVFRAPAANEAGFEVRGTAFHLVRDVDAAPQREIEEVRWLDLSRPYPADLAPLLEHAILPGIAPR